MNRPTFWLGLAIGLFTMFAPEVLNPGLPLREAQISILASIFVGYGLALLLTPRRSGWDVRTLLRGTVFLLGGMAFLVRTAVVFHEVGVWRVVAVAVIESLFYFVVTSLSFRLAARESTWAR